MFGVRSWCGSGAGRPIGNPPDGHPVRRSNTPETGRSVPRPALRPVSSGWSVHGFGIRAVEQHRTVIDLGLETATEAGIGIRALLDLDLDLDLDHRR